jgi:hypothetical protein
MLWNEMPEQLEIVETRDETVIYCLVDHIHHRIFEEAKVKHHLRLFASFIQHRAGAGYFYAAPMPMNRSAFRWVITLCP